MEPRHPPVSYSCSPPQAASGGSETGLRNGGAFEAMTILPSPLGRRRQPRDGEAIGYGLRAKRRRKR